MAFLFEQFPSLELEQLNYEDRRTYRVPNTTTEYVSVTTALSYFSDATITQWRAAVGEAAADRISRLAASQGQQIHSLMEEYILYGNLPNVNQNPIAYQRFNELKKIIDDNLSVVYGVELRMYSDEIKAAGTTDLLCKFAGKNTVLDFKTSRRIKTKDDIFTYFLQGASYAIMAKERYEWEAEQIVICMSIENEGVRTFIEPINDRLIKTTKKFYQLYHEGKLK